MAEDHVKGLYLPVADVAVSRQGVDGENVESVVEEQQMPGGIGDAGPTGLGEVGLDVAISGRFAVVLRLANGEGDLSIGPFDHGGEMHIVFKDLVGGQPSFQILQRCRVNDAKLVSERRNGWIVPQIHLGQGNHRRNQPEFRWNRDFDDPTSCIVEFHEMLGAAAQSGVGMPKLLECLPGLSQDFEFASQSARLFGFVRGASGPVTPIARAVVTAKVA